MNLGECPMPSRALPTSVQVFSILNIVFGVLGLCGMVAAGALLAGPALGPNPALDAMQQSGFFRVFTIVGLVLGFLAAVVLVASGIGMRGLKPWARKAAIGYALYAILSVIAGTVVNAVYVWQPLWDQLGGPMGPAEAGAMGGIIGGIVGSCLGVVYPALLLYFMLRPNVGAAFGAGDSPFGPTYSDSPRSETGNPYQSPGP
jgi:hypothetical protein